MCSVGQQEFLGVLVSLAPVNAVTVLGAYLNSPGELSTAIAAWLKSTAQDQRGGSKGKV